MNSYTAVPQYLTEKPNWVVWGGDKTPYDPKSNGTPIFAKANDPATWASFEVAVSAADILSGNDYKGIGFEFQGTDICGIDFDGCVHDGVVEPYVLAILKLLDDAYTEYSPSEKGLHTFFRCDALPAGQRKFSKNKYGTEIYHGSEPGRYFTVSGNRFAGSGVPKIENIELIYFLVSQIHNEKFKKLWMGDTSDYGDDQSRADLALLDLLVPLFKRDVQKIEKAFGASKLGQRSKWTERKDYRDRTMAKAMGGKFVESGNSPPENVGDYRRVGEPAGAVRAIERIGNTIKPKKVKWLWQDRIPLGKITLFAGNPDNGKSIAAGSVAAICSTGRAFPNNTTNPVPPSDVLMLVGEDDLDDTAVPRLMAAGADMSKIHFIEAVERAVVGEDELRLDLDMVAIETKLQEWPNIRLVIIDPISNYLGEVSMVAEQDARRVLIPLKKLAAKYNVGVIIVMHLNKKSDLDAISRVGGAMAFIGVARCSWAFVRDTATEDGELPNSFTMSRLKNNLTASGSGLAYRIESEMMPLTGLETMSVPVVVWGEPVNKTADEALGKHRHEPGRPEGTDSKLQDAIRFLENALKDGPRHRKELFDDAQESKGLSPATLRRAQEHLGIKPHGKGKDWVWELPPINATTETVTDAASAESSLIQVTR